MGADAATKDNSSPDLPQPPWRLTGEMVAMIGLVPLSVARSHVPGDLDVVRVLPGYTTGAIWVGHYTESSGGAYNEVGFAPALVRSRGSRATWISHLFVDTELAVRAGREIWGLNKEIADIQWTFDHDSDGRERVDVLMTRDDEELLHWSVTRQRIPFPGRYTLPCTSQLGDRLLKWTAQIRSKVHKVHSELWLDESLSELRPLPATVFAGELVSAVVSAPI